MDKCMKKASDTVGPMLRRGTLLLSGLLAFSAAWAQPPSFATDPAELARMALRDERGSVSVGVLQAGQTRFTFLQNDGAVASHNAEPTGTDAQPLYEIGSISKVFTGLLLAQSVERGDLALDDNLGSLLQGKAVLSPEVAAITLRQLVTHSACLPWDPPDFEGYASGDPFSRYNRRRLLAALSNQPMVAAPPCAAAYSNFGLGVVGLVLSERYGKPWQQLVHESITGPLGMQDTVQDLGDKATRMAPAFNHTVSAPLWDFDVLAAAGALRSTASDLLIFSRALMAGRDGPLGPAVERLLTPLGRYRESEIGYAVMMRGPPEKRTYFHSGVTAGFRALWMIAPDTGEAVVVLASSAHAQPGRVFVGLAASRYPVSQSPVTLDSASLAAYAGVYQVDRSTTLTFVPQDGNLYRRVIGGGYRPLRPAGNDTFIDIDAGAVYVFARENGVLTGVDLTQGGGRMRAIRTDKAAPTLAVVAPDREADYPGHYHLDRTLRRNLDFDVKVEGGQLGVRSANWERKPVFPVVDRPDRFAYENGRSQLQFERDANGKVVALVLYEGGELRMQRLAN
jgi:CubicO group peptidase (beta-lactamase class C family)